MVIDSSALIAILNNEPEAIAMATAMAESPVNRLSIVSWVETGIVVESVSIEQGRAARHAYQSYGKGRHPAGLNFGDCFAFALAIVRDEPLIFKGGDFSQTDILQVVY